MMKKVSKKLKEIKKWCEIINRYTIPYPYTPIFQPLTFTEIKTAGRLPIETAPKDEKDIKKYLRKSAEDMFAYGWGEVPPDPDVLLEAADYIEKLENEINDLKEKYKALLKKS